MDRGTVSVKQISKAYTLEQSIIAQVGMESKSHSFARELY